MIDIDQPQEIKDFLLKYSKNPRGFVILAGKNGTGKTYAALAVYHSLTPHQLPAYDHDYAAFFSQSTLNLRWQHEARAWGSAIDLCKTLSTTRLLVLDDIGTRIPSEAFMDFLYQIVDIRFSSRAATIITTNLNMADLRQKFGDAFTSRVASGQCFRFEGEDRRFKPS